MEPGPSFRKHLYFDLPHMVTCNYVELVRELMTVKLDDLPDRVEDLATELVRRADAGEAAQRDLGAAHDLARERAVVDVERETDELGQMIQQSFECWELITNPIVRPAAKPEQAERDKRAKQDELGRRAAAANQAMFGDDKLEFMRMSYPDRMRRALAMIRTLRADPELLELLHEPVRLLVSHLGEHYEQRLGEHLLERDEPRGLGPHRVALRWGLTVYASEVGELADRWSEASCNRVNSSLMPFVTWNQRMKSQH